MTTGLHERVKGQLAGEEHKMYEAQANRKGRDGTGISAGDVRVDLAPCISFSLDPKPGLSTWLIVQGAFSLLDLGFSGRGIVLALLAVAVGVLLSTSDSRYIQARWKPDIVSSRVQDALERRSRCRPEPIIVAGSQ
jgi:hypothetical protein